MVKLKSIHSRRVGTGQRPYQQILFSSVDGPDVGWSVPSSSKCRVVSVGKRRDGGTRYWCLLHRADATAKYGRPADRCRASHILPISPEDTFELDMDKYKGGIALWGAVPAVYDTTRLAMDRGIHVHARLTPGATKEMDRTFRALRIVSQSLPESGVTIYELDAIYYMVSSIFGYSTKQIICSHCGCAHLDRDWFSVHPHQRHLCAGCGRQFRDSEISIGNPIMGLREACGARAHKLELSKKKLDISQADFPGGIQIWGSNSAFIWTSDATEDEGIHVHAFRQQGEKPDLDETYGRVTVDGVNLNPTMVRVLMAQSTMPSLKNRVLPIECTSCGASQFSTGELAFTPVATHTCKRCGHKFSAAGRLRKTIANPLPRILARLTEKAPREPQHHELGLMPETL
jgi:hypothetical protein